MNLAQDLVPFVERPARRFFLAALWEGFVAPWEGFRFLARRPALWRYGLWPLLVNVLLSIAAVIGLYYGVGALLATLTPWLPGGWLGNLLYWAAAAGLVVVALGIVVGAWMALGALLCAMAYGRLVERTERELGLDPSEMKPLSLWKEASDAVRLALRVALVNAGCLLLHLVPAVGSFLALGVSTYVSSYWFGFEYLDYPLALRGRTLDEKRRFATAHRFHTHGLGLAVLGMTFVPVLGGVGLTTAVVGAALLHRRLAASRPAAS